jgi:hypothetical protein
MNDGVNKSVFHVTVWQSGQRTQGNAMQNQIKIGPSFFAKAKNDYSDWRWAWVRELAQNSIDAPKSSKISFEFAFDGENTIATCLNNGSPMSKETLVNKFLSIGESGKGFEGTVGGFGKAKELIAFCHAGYQIRTGELLVRGAGASYDLTEDELFLHGTMTTVVMSGDLTGVLGRQVQLFASLAQWDGVITLNGVELACNLRKGSPRRELSLGKVYSNKSFENLVVVRVKGMPMFTLHTEFKGCVVVELEGSSVECLTANRDGLVWGKRRELEDLLTELAVNKKSGLRALGASYQKFDGPKLARQKSLDVRELVGAVPAEAQAFSSVVAFNGNGGSGGEAREVVEVQRVRLSQLDTGFIVRNEMELKVPEYYLPDSEKFGTYARKLAKLWGRLLVELYELFDVDGVFSIGFVFSEEAEALHERSREHGRVYYVNPAEVVAQASSASKSLKKRFLLTERDRLLSIAVHEFVHGLGFSAHDEEYASQLTDAFAKVMKSRKRFNWCFND